LSTVGFSWHEQVISWRFPAQQFPGLSTEVRVVHYRQLSPMPEQGMLFEWEGKKTRYKRKENILSADAMIVFGTRISAMGLDPCGMCGFSNCAEKNKHPAHPCVFNTGDLGIAMGSAAMDNRIDNRIMYTVRQALLEMGDLGEDVKIIYGMPLSISGKNPFMDRNKEELIGRA